MTGLGAENRIGIIIKGGGLCFRPFIINSSELLLFKEILLPFNGETNRFANLEGESDLLHLDAIDEDGLGGDFLLKGVVFVAGEKEFKPLCGLLIFTGDLTKNL